MIEQTATSIFRCMLLRHTALTAIPILEGAMLTEEEAFAIANRQYANRSRLRNQIVKAVCGGGKYYLDAKPDDEAKAAKFVRDPMLEEFKTHEPAEPH